MSDELEPQSGVGGPPNRWKYPVAALIIVVVLGLVVWQTYATGEIPYQIVIPLLGAALWAVFNFRISDFTDRGR